MPNRRVAVLPLLLYLGMQSSVTLGTDGGNVIKSPQFGNKLHPTSYCLQHSKDQEFVGSSSRESCTVHKSSQACSQNISASVGKLTDGVVVANSTNTSEWESFTGNDVLVKMEFFFGERIQLCQVDVSFYSHVNGGKPGNMKDVEIAIFYAGSRKYWSCFIEDSSYETRGNAAAMITLARKQTVEEHANGTRNVLVYLTAGQLARHNKITFQEIGISEVAFWECGCPNDSSPVVCNGQFATSPCLRKRSIKYNCSRSECINDYCYVPPGEHGSFGEVGCQTVCPADNISIADTKLPPSTLPPSTLPPSTLPPSKETEDKVSPSYWAIIITLAILLAFVLASLIVRSCHHCQRRKKAQQQEADPSDYTLYSVIRRLSSSGRESFMWSPEKELALRSAQRSSRVSYIPPMPEEVQVNLAGASDMNSGATREEDHEYGRLNSSTSLPVTPAKRAANASAELDVDIDENGYSPMHKQEVMQRSNYKKSADADFTAGDDKKLRLDWQGQDPRYVYFPQTNSPSTPGQDVQSKRSDPHPYPLSIMVKARESVDKSDVKLTNRRSLSTAL